MLEVAEADLALEAGVPCERARACGNRSPELVDANDRRTGPLRWRSGPRRTPPRCTELTADGTEGSQPLPPWPGTVGFSIVFLWQHEYWNQFSLNLLKNTILPINI